MDQFKKHMSAKERSLFVENEVVWYCESDQSLPDSIQFDNLSNDKEGEKIMLDADVIRRFGTSSSWNVAVVEKMMKHSVTGLASSRRQFIPRYNIKKFNSLVEDPLSLLTMVDGEKQQWIYQSIVHQDQLIPHGKATETPDLLSIPFKTFNSPEILRKHLHRASEWQKLQESHNNWNQHAFFTPIGEHNYICNPPSIRRKLDAVVFDQIAMKSIRTTAMRDMKEDHDHSIVLSGETPHREKERLFQQFVSLFATMNQDNIDLEKLNVHLNVGLELLRPFGIVLSEESAVQTHLKHVSFSLNPNDGSICGGQIHIGHVGQLHFCSWFKIGRRQMIENWRYQILYILASDLAQSNISSRDQKYSSVVERFAAKYGILDREEDYALFKGFSLNRKINLEYNLWDIMRWMRRIGMTDNEIDHIFSSLSACLLLLNWEPLSVDMTIEELLRTRISPLLEDGQRMIGQLSLYKTENDGVMLRNALVEQLYGRVIEFLVAKINDTASLLFENHIQLSDPLLRKIHLIHLPDISSHDEKKSIWSLYSHFVNHASLQSNLRQEKAYIGHTGGLTSSSEWITEIADEYACMPILIEEYLSKGEEDGLANDLRHVMAHPWMVHSTCTSTANHLSLMPFPWSQSVSFGRIPKLNVSENCFITVRSLLEATSMDAPVNNLSPWSLLDEQMEQMRQLLDNSRLYTLHCFAHAGQYPFSTSIFNRLLGQINTSGLFAVSILHDQSLIRSISVDELVKAIPQTSEPEKDSLNSFFDDLALNTKDNIMYSEDGSTVLLSRYALNTLELEIDPSQLAQLVHHFMVNPWYIHTGYMHGSHSIERNIDREVTMDHNETELDDNIDSVFGDLGSGNDSLAHQQHMISMDGEADLLTNKELSKQQDQRPFISDIFRHTPLEGLVRFEPNPAVLIKSFQSTGTSDAIFPVEILRIIGSIYCQNDEILDEELFFLMNYNSTLLVMMSCSPRDMLAIEIFENMYTFVLQSMGSIVQSVASGEEHQDLEFCQRLVLEILSVLFIFSSFDRGRLLLKEEVVNNALNFMRSSQVIDVLITIVYNYVMLPAKTLPDHILLHNQDNRFKQNVVLMCCCILRDICILQKDSCDYLVCHDNGKSFWKILGLMDQAVHQFCFMSSAHKVRSPHGIHIDGYGIMVNLLQETIDHILSDHTLVRELALNYEDALQHRMETHDNEDSIRRKDTRKRIRHVRRLLKDTLKTLLELVTVADDIIEQAAFVDNKNNSGDTSIEYLPIYDRAVIILKESILRLSNEQQLVRAMSITAKLSYVIGSRYRSEELLQCVMHRLLDPVHHETNRIALAMIIGADNAEHARAEASQTRVANKCRSMYLPQKQHRAMMQDAREMGIVQILAVNILRVQSDCQEVAHMSATALIMLCRQDKRYIHDFMELLQKANKTSITQVLASFNVAKMRCDRQAVARFLTTMQSIDPVEKLDMETRCYDMLRTSLRNDDQQPDIENQI